MRVLSLDAAKKLLLEKHVVIGLAGLLALAGGVGVLRRLGRPARPAAAAHAAPPVEQVSVSQPLAAMMHQGWDQVSQQAEASLHGGRDEAAKPPLYTAQRLRDPLRSLLPESVPPDATLQQALPPPPPAPMAGVESSQPPLRVQGVVWGGADPKVIINDRVYGLNDQVDGGEILAIDRRGVTIDYRGEVVSYAPSSATPEGFEPSMSSGQFHQGR